MVEVLRQEKKYLLPLPEARRLSGRLQAVMLQDSHNGPRGYRIRSLYFDTLDDRDFADWSCAGRYGCGATTRTVISRCWR